MFRFQFESECNCDHPVVEIFDQPEVAQWVYDHMGNIEKYHKLRKFDSAKFNYSYDSNRQKNFSRLPIFQKILLFNPKNTVPIKIIDLVEEKLTSLLSSQSECKLTMSIVTTNEDEIFYLQIHLSKDSEHERWPCGKNVFYINSQIFQCRIELD
jgi:hypothetical protein